jgi:hypothetical protein
MYKRKLHESFRQTTTANVTCYKKKAFMIVDRPIADVPAMGWFNQFKEWTVLMHKTVL